ncbi:MAG: sel1 repeat family protein [Labilithrix sp.]|nr:sel1 repeat family protein [Labilithrix sp.]
MVTLLLTACGHAGSSPPPRAADAVGEADGVLYAVDWPTSARADLEATVTRSLALVSYQPPGPVRVLPSCTAPGAYRVEAVAPKEDVVRLATREQIGATLPFSAPSLTARLEAGASEERVFDLAVVTRRRASAPALPISATDLQGDCAGATHVVTSYQRGAFVLVERTRRDVASSVDIFSLGARAGSHRDGLVSKSDGDPAACRTGSDEACTALVKVALRPLSRSSAATAPHGAGTWSSSWKARPYDGEVALRCDRGDLEACVMVGANVQDADPQRAERYYRLACDGGVGHACSLLAFLYDPTAGRGGGDEGKARTLYLRGCDLGSLDACSMLTEYLRWGSELEPKEDSLAKRVARACDGGSKDEVGWLASCYGASYWYATAFKQTKSRAQMKPLIEEALRLHRRYCDAATANDLAKYGACMLDDWTRARSLLEQSLPER